MEESNDEYIPSCDEEDIFVTPCPERKAWGKASFRSNEKNVTNDFYLL